jgi:hypothetical protein
VLALLQRKGVSAFAPNEGLVDEATVFEEGKLLVRTINHIKVVMGPAPNQLAAKAYLAIGRV